MAVLSQIPDRLDFLKFLEKEIQKDSVGVVVFVDVDHYSKIQNFLGSIQSEDLLFRVSAALCQSIRYSRVVYQDFLAHIGEDRFVLYLHGIFQKKEIAGVMKRIEVNIALLSKNFPMQIKISVTCGVRVLESRKDGRIPEPEELLGQAVIAWCDAKDKKLRFSCYEDGMKEVMVDALKLVSRIEESILERHFQNFSLVYQPIIEAKKTSYRTVGCEVLCRLRLEEKDIPPERFIPLAERHGLMAELGKWILTTALKQKLELVQHGSPLWFSINISPYQLLQEEEFLRLLDVLLRRYQNHPGQIHLEVTESGGMDGDLVSQSMIKIFQKLRKMGFVLSCDDFGIGYSSFQRLLLLPIQILKIERFFLEDMVCPGEKKIALKSIVRLANSLKLKVVAEGVEELEQAKFLSRAGCHFLQGYYFGRPADISQLVKM